MPEVALIDFWLQSYFDSILNFNKRQVNYSIHIFNPSMNYSLEKCETL